MKFLGIHENKWHILNDKEGNITAAQIMKIFSKLENGFKKNPNRKYNGFFIFGGHGILKEGQQHLMLNYTDKRNPHFSLYNVESRVRMLSSRFGNTYTIGIFAMCRENHRPDFYKTFVIAKTQAEAEKLIEEQKQANAAY